MTQETGGGWGSTTKVVKGTLSEYRALLPFLKKIVASPGITPRDKTEGSITLEATSPDKDDPNNPWKDARGVQLTIAPDGTVSGTYTDTGGKGTAPFAGKLSKEELASVRADLAKVKFAATPEQGKGAFFWLATSAGDQSRWVSGKLADYPSLVPIVKRLATLPEKLAAEPKPPARTPGLSGAFEKVGGKLP